MDEANDANDVNDANDANDANTLMLVKLTRPRERSPDTLFDICTRYCVENFKLLCSVPPPAPGSSHGFGNDDDYDDDEDYHMLEPMDGLTLPSEICNKLMEAYQMYVGEVDDRFAYFFRNVNKTKLTSVRIRNSSITDYGLLCLLRHDLHVLSIEGCRKLTHKSFINLLKHAVNLRRLTIGPRVSICPTLRMPSVCHIGLNIYEAAPSLQCLNLVMLYAFSRFGNEICVRLPPDENSTIRSLNITQCSDIGDLDQILAYPNLHTLVLYNCIFAPESRVVSNICTLTNLVLVFNKINIYS